MRVLQRGGLLMDWKTSSMIFHLANCEIVNLACDSWAAANCTIKRNVIPLEDWDFKMNGMDIYISFSVTLLPFTDIICSHLWSGMGAFRKSLILTCQPNPQPPVMKDVTARTTCLLWRNRFLFRNWTLSPGNWKDGTLYKKSHWEISCVVWACIK